MAEAKRPARRSHQSLNHPHKVEEKPPRPPPSWVSLKGLFSNNHPQQHAPMTGKKKKEQQHGRLRCSVSICNTRDTSDLNKLAGSRPEAFSPKQFNKLGTLNSRSGSRKTPLKEINGPRSSSTTSSCTTTPSKSATTTNSSPSLGGPLKGVQFRRFYGCYECHSVVDPIGGFPREPSLRSSICSCPDCGQIFVKPESLELHQAARHAVSELGPEDTSRNVVEIIFQSSWLIKKPAAPACKIDRILKINNTQKTISRFEDYRELIRTRARQLLIRKHPRCIADGNELLRFYSTTFTCSIGLKGSTSLCHSTPSCKACSIIRDGFKADPSGGIRTMATSGRAHEAVRVSSEHEKRAMLVCRVIAGRVRKSQDSTEECDSIAGPYSALDELFVFNARAILPCFLVIYREV